MDDGRLAQVVLGGFFLFVSWLGTKRMNMSQPNVPAPAKGPNPTNLNLRGGAAIIAPPSAFPSGVPGNALIVLPLGKPPEELTEKIKSGAVVVSTEEMWKLLGFNGPAVQVQDQEGRPIAIGLEDLLEGLEKHWEESKEDAQRGRLFAQELMKYGRFEKAEKVLAKVVATGGTGDDWLALGVAQLQLEKWEKAEGTLRGAQNLLPENPFPSLHLARVLKGKDDQTGERDAVERAISIDGNCVDAWAYLFGQVRDLSGEEAAIARIKELADAEPNRRRAAPFIALQGIFSADEATRDKAIEWAKFAVERNPNDPLALISLSALYGQKGDLPSVIALLRPHEGKMATDVRLANNYFEALFQSRDIERVTKLLNALAGSSNREVKQFAIERSRSVAQFLQQQQQRLAGANANPRPS
jgi:tetratricopeptide (TPR) repeat protein